eukprot:2044570-Rhodomonas_salina.1
MSNLTCAVGLAHSTSAHAHCVQPDVCGRRASLRHPPHLTSPHLTSPHLTSPHLTLPHVTSRHVTSKATSSHTTRSHDLIISPYHHKSNTKCVQPDAYGRRAPLRQPPHLTSSPHLVCFLQHLTSQHLAAHDH